MCLAPIVCKQCASRAHPFQAPGALFYPEGLNSGAAICPPAAVMRHPPAPLGPSRGTPTNAYYSFGEFAGCTRLMASSPLLGPPLTL